MARVALLTGRGGSSLKDKNIRPIFNVPVLGYAASAARSSGVFDYFFCSSNDQRILDVARNYDFEPIARPDSLSQADSLHIHAIEHAIEVIEALSIEVTELFVFLANNVCTTKKMITQAFSILEADKECTSVVPLYRENDRNPLRAFTKSRDSYLTPFVDRSETDFVSSNRQELKPSFFLCHNFWAISVANQRPTWNGYYPWRFLGNKVRGLEVGELTDIHTDVDLLTSADWIRKNKRELSVDINESNNAGENG